MLWVNPSDSNHIINGNDGGINMSFDGETLAKLNQPKVGQFYTGNVDLKTPYNVYGVSKTMASGWLKTILVK